MSVKTGWDGKKRKTWLDSREEKTAQSLVSYTDFLSHLACKVWMWMLRLKWNALSHLPQNAGCLYPLSGHWALTWPDFVLCRKAENSKQKEAPLQREGPQKQQHDRFLKHMALSLKLDLTISLSPWAVTSLLCTSNFLAVKWLMIVSTSWLWWSLLTTNEALKGRALSPWQLSVWIRT